MKLLWVVTMSMLVFLSCDEKIFTGDVNCDECFRERPANADLIIDLTLNNKYPAVRITVYNGDVEDNDIFSADTAFVTPFFVFVPVDRKYSVKADYVGADQTIFAVDGTRIKVLAVTDACDERCYVVENETLDVRLRKEFQ